MHLYMEELTRDIGRPYSLGHLDGLVGTAKVPYDPSAMVRCIHCLRRSYLLVSVSGCTSGFIRGRAVGGRCFMSGKLLRLFVGGPGASLLRGLYAVALCGGCNGNLCCCGEGVRISFCIPSRKLTIRTDCRVDSRRAVRQRIGTLMALRNLCPLGQTVVVACRSRKRVIHSKLGVRVEPT